jgi:hypothetical protein
MGKITPVTTAFTSNPDQASQVVEKNRLAEIIPKAWLLW